MGTALQHSPVSLLPLVYSTCHKLSSRTCNNTFYIRSFSFTHSVLLKQHVLSIPHPITTEETQRGWLVRQVKFVYFPSHATSNEWAHFAFLLPPASWTATLPFLVGRSERTCVNTVALLMLAAVTSTVACRLTDSLRLPVFIQLDTLTTICFLVF
jgi:hypothetical protein